MLNITNLKETVESIITNSALTHEQAMSHINRDIFFRIMKN